MAWIFGMWIETENSDQAVAIKAYFNHKVIDANGKTYKISADESGTVTVDGISRTGITAQSDAEEMTLIGFEFYQLLKAAPDFRYALTGVEVDEWRTMEELEEEPNDILLIPGFVIRSDVYKRLGSPGNLKAFSLTHLWTPYEGEHWSEN